MEKPSEVAARQVPMRKKGHKKNQKPQSKGNKKKNQIMREEIENLKKRRSELSELTADDLISFAKLPISAKTLKGLKNAGFTVPTKVQRQSLLYSLDGCDVVAAAKTGSGKTLAFIIPILELLYSRTWTQLDGLGALVITPTRELAYQIFDVLNKVGKEHDFSAGLVIGGTDVTFEWKRIRNCNIMICTPGRLFQHMTENPDFICENLQVLVLDEADMILSMGFADTVNCILDELTPDRQTLLFSATQTRDVKDLIRAGCQNPVFCSVHEHSKTTTPKGLVESYVVHEAHEKFTFLWSFITFHKKQKILIFLSTCKQVKYLYNMFCKLQPGLSVMGLHGNMKQLKRMAIYDQFCRKKAGVLFATDVAARGLDIPEVHWVVQADCPEDVTTYIHRAGRTARYSKAGEAILVLTPSEEPDMVKKLKAKNIPIEKIFADAKKQHSVSVKMEIVLTKYKELKEDAVRAFKSYIKHVAQMKDKKVFNVLSIDRDAYARSLGLIVTPRIRFIEKLLKQNLCDAGIKNNSDDAYRDKDEYCHKTLDFGADISDDDDDGFLTSSKNQFIPEKELAPEELKMQPKKKKVLTKADVANKLMRKNIRVNKVLEFDDEGNVIIDPTKIQTSIATQDNDLSSHGINISELKKIMKNEDVIDRKIYRAKVKEEKLAKKLKEKERKKKGIEESEGEEKDESEDSDEDEGIQDIIDSLPDPDKIYDKKNEDDSEGSSSEEESDGEDADESSEEESDGKDEKNERSETSSDEESVEESPKLHGKRKAKLKAQEAKRAKLAENNTLSALPMDEQEQLALFLLSGRK